MTSIVKKICVHVCVLSHFSHVQFFAIPWTTAHQSPLSMGLPFPPPGDIPDPGIEPMSPVSPAIQMDSLLTEPPEKP